MAGTAGRARLAAAAVLTGAAALAIVRVALAAAAPAAPVLAPRAPVLRPAPAAVATTVARPPSDPAPATRPAAVPPLVVTHVIDTGGPLRYGAYFWDDGAVPPGPLTIAIDLKASVLSVFRGDYEIGTTAVIYGADDRETPLGTFPILQKDRHHVSNLYHAPMPYMLRLTGDGVSIHASAVAADYATHGCIGVPTGFAKRLFAIAQVGDRVIVTRKGLNADLKPA